MCRLSSGHPFCRLRRPLIRPPNVPSPSMDGAPLPPSRPKQRRPPSAARHAGLLFIVERRVERHKRGPIMSPGPPSSIHRSFWRLHSVWPDRERASEVNAVCASASARPSSWAWVPTIACISSAEHRIARWHAHRRRGDHHLACRKSPGEGRIGSGKSTLIHAMAGLWPLESAKSCGPKAPPWLHAATSVFYVAHRGAPSSRRAGGAG